MQTMLLDMLTRVIGTAIVFLPKLVTTIPAGHYLHQVLPEGEAVEVEGRRGAVDQSGPIATVFRDGETKWTILSRRLMDDVISQ